jgi:hypothetical protein
VFVTEDPERAWPLLMPHLLEETNSYARWAQEGGASVPYQEADEATIRSRPGYRVVTPAECVELANGLGPDGVFLLHPLPGGLDPEVAWSSLELFEQAVLPALQRPQSRR